LPVIHQKLEKLLKKNLGYESSLQIGSPFGLRVPKMFKCITSGSGLGSGSTEIRVCVRDLGSKRIFNNFCFGSGFWLSFLKNIKISTKFLYKIYFSYVSRWLFFVEINLKNWNLSKKLFGWFCDCVDILIILFYWHLSLNVCTKSDLGLGTGSGFEFFSSKFSNFCNLDLSKMPDCRMFKLYFWCSL
jgi:hypothetical protein